MRMDRYLWILLSVVLCLPGTHLLLDSVRHPGPFAETSIIFGGVLDALGLVAVFFAFEEHLRVRALARHLRRGSHSVRKSGTQGTGKNS
jgi:hypothetical protein